MWAHNTFAVIPCITIGLIFPRSGLVLLFRTFHSSFSEFLLTILLSASSGDIPIHAHFYQWHANIYLQHSPTCQLPFPIEPCLVDLRMWITSCTCTSDYFGIQFSDAVIF